jgi:hypothetical protein
MTTLPSNSAAAVIRMSGVGHTAALGFRRPGRPLPGDREPAAQWAEFTQISRSYG